VEGRLLTAALQLAVKEDSESSAGVAVVLLDVMKELQAKQEVLAGGLGAQVLKLLCKYNHIIRAAVLLPHCASSSDAVAVFFTSAAAQQVEQQQKALKELGAGVKSNPGVREAIRASMTNFMERSNSCALGLLWQALHNTSNQDDVVPVLQTLSKTQQEQVLKLCFGSRPSPAAPSFTARRLAGQMMLSPADLSVESAAEWLSAIAKDQEELQPCRAAVLLGVVREEQLMGAGGSSIGSKYNSREASVTGNVNAEAVADVDGSLKLMAQLCLAQLGETLSSTDVLEVQAAVDWVGRLSPEILTPEAAAAVLFAVWYLQQQQQQEEGDAPHISPVAAGVIGLALYHAARKGSALSAAVGWTAKPSLDSLVLDLALAAAVGAEQWEEGKACLLFIHCADEYGLNMRSTHPIKVVSSAAIVDRVYTVLTDYIRYNCDSLGPLLACCCITAPLHAGMEEQG
jgi:hypothetical protein